MGTYHDHALELSHGYVSISNTIKMALLITQIY